MASITRTKKETVATVTANRRKIKVFIEKELTIEESRELRSLLKAEERKAERQGANDYTFSIPFNPLSREFYYGTTRI